MALVELEVADSIGTITMNNRNKRNALSSELIGEILGALAGLGTQEVRVVVLRATPGVKVWSAGHDVSELPTTRRDPLGWGDPLRQVVREIEAFPAPVLAMVEGSVWGGACEVAFACDMIIAGHDSTFAVTPAKLGVPYNTSGLLNFMNAASRCIIREMVFTGDPISADRAETLGMINYVVDRDELEKVTYALAARITCNAPLSIAVIKEQFRIMESAHTITPLMFERIQGLRRTVYDSEDYKEGIGAFMQKRKPVFKGS